MLDYLLLSVLVLVLLFNTSYWLVVRPARKAARRRQIKTAEREHEEATSACPHAGAIPVESGGETVAWLCPACDQQLDVNWKPPPPEVEELRRRLDAVRKRPPLILSSAAEISVAGSPGAQINIGSGNAQEMITNGMATVNEMRERIVQAMTVPPPAVGGAGKKEKIRLGCPFPGTGDLAMVTEQFDRPNAPTLWGLRCTCGGHFAGSVSVLTDEMREHMKHCPVR